MKTLQDFYSAAGIPDRFEWAEQIELHKQPWKHQVTGLNQALHYNRYGLYDEPAVGKTLPSMAVALYYAGMGNKVVILMPPVLLRQYLESLLDDLGGIEQRFHIHLLREDPAQRKKLEPGWNNFGWPDLLLMTYAKFLRMSKQLKIVGYNVLICDEAHALKTPGSQIHKAVKYFLGPQDRGQSACLMMTGTPLPNEPILDAYGLIKLITPDAYTDKMAYEREHCVYITHQGRERDWKELVGYVNTEKVTFNLYRQARRVLRVDVFDIKQPRIIELPIDLSPQHLALYRKLLKERLLLVDGMMIDAIQAQALRMKALQIVANPEEFSDQGKAPENQIDAALEQILDSVGALHTTKVLVFCHFRMTIRRLTAKLSALNPATVYGGSADNEAQKDKFLNDPTCRVMLANPKSGGEGLNLQSVCSTVVFLEPTSVPGVFKQAVARVDRPGQTNPVVVYVFKALYTIAPKLTVNMLRKEGEAVLVQNDGASLMEDLLGA